MIGANGELDESFNADRFIKCIEMQSQHGVQSLPIGGKEQALVPSAGRGEGSKLKSIFTYRHFSLTKMIISDQLKNHHREFQTPCRNEW